MRASWIKRREGGGRQSYPRAGLFALQTDRELSDLSSFFLFLHLLLTAMQLVIINLSLLEYWQNSVSSMICLKNREWIDNAGEKNYSRDFVASFFIMSPQKSYFILTSLVLAAMRVNVVLMLLKNGKIRKLCCYEISCKKIVVSMRKFHNEITCQNEIKFFRWHCKSWRNRIANNFRPQRFLRKHSQNFYLRIQIFKKCLVFFCLILN